MSGDAKAPGFWLFTGDFERDVQILPLSAVGLWSRMLCWMNENEAHRGFLELPNGSPMTVLDIAQKSGKPLNHIRRAMAAMERIGTYSKDERGCIYNRRMAREQHIAEVRSKAAKSRADRAVRASNGTFVPPIVQSRSMVSKLNTSPPLSMDASMPIKSTVDTNLLDGLVENSHQQVIQQTPTVSDSVVNTDIAALPKGSNSMGTSKNGMPPPQARKAFIETLTGYPGSTTLPGAPDEAILRRCWDPIHVFVVAMKESDATYRFSEIDVLKEIFRKMESSKKRPAISWQWFPTMIEAHLSHVPKATGGKQ